MLVSLFKADLDPGQIAYYIVVMFIALMFAFSIHEFMHAAAATFFGDDTAKHLGRLTLNPIAHLDPMGTVLLMLVGFGWGKPVPYNPNNITRYKNKSAMCIVIHAAGVIGNFILALVFVIIMSVIVRCGMDENSYVPEIIRYASDYYAGDGVGDHMVYSIFSISGMIYPDNMVINTIMDILYYTSYFCVGLFAFNLIPIPPLDGFHILEELIPYRIKYTDGYRNFMMYAPRILLMVVFIGSMADVHLFSGLIDIISWPVNQVLNLVSGLIVGA